MLILKNPSEKYDHPPAGGGPVHRLSEYTVA